MVLTKNCEESKYKETAQIYWQHKRKGHAASFAKAKPLFNLEVSAEMSLLYRGLS